MKVFSKDPMPTPRVALAVEYDGSGFHGFQIQTRPKVPTVQGALAEAVSFVANETIQLYCAGRTDAGVHATRQVVSFSTGVTRSEMAWVRGVNARLPDSIAVTDAFSVSDDFHARFSAKARTYRYVIYNAPLRSPFLHGKVTHIDMPLNNAAMHQAAQSLVGEHDFSGFRASGCQSLSAFRHVDWIRINRSGDFIYADIKANAFLLHMVRNIMGVLIDIGLGYRPLHYAAEVLEGRDRSLGSVTAKPQGLYFVGVDYGKDTGANSPVRYPVFDFTED